MTCGKLDSRLFLNHKNGSVLWLTAEQFPSVVYIRRILLLHNPFVNQAVILFATRFRLIFMKSLGKGRAYMCLVPHFFKPIKSQIHFSLNRWMVILV